jgi:hypothetical protein
VINVEWEMVVAMAEEIMEMDMAAVRLEVGAIE